MQAYVIPASVLHHSQRRDLYRFIVHYAMEQAVLMLAKGLAVMIKGPGILAKYAGLRVTIKPLCVSPQSRAQKGMT